MRLIVNGAISPAFRMVSTDLLWDFGKEPHGGWHGNARAPLSISISFLLYETEVENDGHPLYLRLVHESPCFFTSYANRAVDQ